MSVVFKIIASQRSEHIAIALLLRSAFNGDALQLTITKVLVKASPKSNFVMINETHSELNHTRASTRNFNKFG